MDEVYSCEKSRVKFFPIMMYAIVMGMSGLTIMYQKAALWLGFTALIGEGLTIFSTMLFVLISLIYLGKYIRYTPLVKQEFTHPIRLNFFAAISISMLMLAIMYKESSPTISASFWYPGAVVHFYLTMYTISFWINHPQALDHSNPAWFIPVVGNVLVPIGGEGCVSHGILVYFFSVGIFFWVILFAILLNRIIFHHPLSNKFMPTLFILIAPPAVGFIAYFKLYGVVDLFALMLFNLALFFTLLLAFMYKNFIKITFFLSWWAFVFPLSAMSISAMLMYHETHERLLLVLSYGMVCITTVVMAIVLYHTLFHMRRGEICVQE